MKRISGLLRRGPSESGQAAGVESIPFGILVFVGGMLLVVNLWAVVDTRAAVDSTAREYLRAYTAAATVDSATIRGHDAAVASWTSRRHGNLRIEAPSGPFGPCQPATVTVEVDVDTIRAPFIGSLGTRTVSSTQTELIQAYSTATGGPGLAGTACAG